MRIDPNFIRATDQAKQFAENGDFIRAAFCCEDAAKFSSTEAGRQACEERRDHYLSLAAAKAQA